MSTNTRTLAVWGVLIALAAASLGALMATLYRPAGIGPSTAPQVLTLAASSTGNTITVVGNGSASGAPNQADLALGVTVTRPSVRDAVTIAGSDMTKLLSALRNNGVQDKDVKTTSIWVSQQTNCCPQTVIGYNASTQISVTVHSVDRVTPLIEAAVDAVGNELQLNGINLSISDTSNVMKAARQDAMNDANTKAQDWARLSGHHLGGLIGMSEEVATNGGFPQYGGKGAGGGVPIQPGVTSVTVIVAVTYELAA